MRIDCLPALSDNYVFCAYDGGDAVVVDPGEAAPALAALRAADAQLRAVLVTHRHADHIGGLAELRAAYPQAAVYAPPDCGIAGATICGDGDELTLLNGALRLRVLATPGHTLEHIAYAGAGFVFCGDTLFIGGCGRVFEGTMTQMHDSLMKLAALPDETKIYCGHEYTVNNLRFAQAVEPDNADIAAALSAAEKLRAAGKPTVPGVLADERRVNPFLRLHAPAVIAAAARAAGETPPDAAAVFAALRRWKDAF